MPAQPSPRRAAHLFVPGKLAYARGERPAVDCILCAIVRRSPKVTKIVVHRERRWWVSLNIYPYNPGHLMIFPVRHVQDLRELNAAERRDFWPLQDRCLEVLGGLYGPPGYNVGLNQGRVAGASIGHLHYHVVPRYPTEIGFMDLIGEARVIVEDPRVTRRKMAAAFKRLAR